MKSFKEFILESSFELKLQKLYDEIKILKDKKSESENELEREKLQSHIYSLEADIKVLSNK